MMTSAFNKEMAKVGVFITVSKVSKLNNSVFSSAPGGKIPGILWDYCN